ncbi:hypothetical protein Ocin01_11133 [Orchesella cincta]|uniref:Uncharacterized protein n=1 Tax=Orchesella cincta TaxID=48709 RepID=A0A1D2MR18_ORCCI|nr:hypothetical protein Ocin01_11133 [Orchesella cincta]
MELLLTSDFDPLVFCHLYNNNLGLVFGRYLGSDLMNFSSITEDVEFWICNINGFETACQLGLTL